MENNSRPAWLNSLMLVLALLMTTGLMSARSEAQGLTSTLNFLIPETGLDLTLNSSTLVNTVNNVNVDSLRTDVLNNWVLPDGTVSGSTASVSEVGRIGDQGFSASQLSPFQNFLSSGELALTPGDKVYQLDYTLHDPTHGTFNFSTLGYESGAGLAKFEPFVYSAPILDDYITVKNPGAKNDVDFSVSNAFGEAAFGGGSLNIVCDNTGKLTNATAVIGQTGATALWEAATTKEPATIFKKNGLDCATTVFHFGFSNGFKSIKAGADGFTLEVTGALGWSGSTESQVTKCCSAITPVPEASSAAGFGLMALLGLLTLAFSVLTHKLRSCH